MRDYTEISKWLRNCADINRGCTTCPMIGKTCCVMTLQGNAADAIEELLDELTTIRKQLPHWISVEERLPEVEQSVLFCVFGRSVGEGTYRGHDGFHHVWKMYAVAGTYWDDEVTHWMPLPEPPKGVE